MARHQARVQGRKPKRRPRGPRLPGSLRSAPAPEANPSFWGVAGRRIPQSTSNGFLTEHDMKAILSTTAGGPETLLLQETADPVAGPGQIVVRVKVSGVNYPDTLCRSGPASDRVGRPISRRGLSGGNPANFPQSSVAEILS